MVSRDFIASSAHAFVHTRNAALCQPHGRHVSEYVRVLFLVPPSDAPMHAASQGIELDQGLKGRPHLGHGHNTRCPLALASDPPWEVCGSTIAVGRVRNVGGVGVGLGGAEPSRWYQSAAVAPSIW